MNKVEYEDLVKAIDNGTQKCFSCPSLNTELIGDHDYDYETKVAVRFFVDFHCRECGFKVRVREQVLGRWDIPFLQPDNENALQYVDLVHK